MTPDQLPPASKESFELVDLGEPTYTVSLPSGGSIISTRPGLAGRSVWREAELENAIQWLRERRSDGEESASVAALARVVRESLSQQDTHTPETLTLNRLDSAIQTWLRKEPSARLDGVVATVIETMVRTPAVNQESQTMSAASHVVGEREQTIRTALLALLGT